MSSIYGGSREKGPLNWVFSVVEGFTYKNCLVPDHDLVFGTKTEASSWAFSSLHPFPASNSAAPPPPKKCVIQSLQKGLDQNGWICDSLKSQAH